MLSRIAESLFWIGRYVERADDTARLLDAFLRRVLEDPWTDEDAECRSLLAILGVPAPRDVVQNTGRDHAQGLLRRKDSVPRSPEQCRPRARTRAAPAKRSRAKCGSASTSRWRALPERRRAAARLGPNTYLDYVRERTAMFSGSRRVDAVARRRLALPGARAQSRACRHDRAAAVGSTADGRSTGHLGHRALGVRRLRGLPAHVRRHGRPQSRRAVLGARPVVPALGAALAVNRRTVPGRTQSAARARARRRPGASRGRPSAHHARVRRCRRPHSRPESSTWYRCKRPARVRARPCRAGSSRTRLRSPGPRSWS